MGNSSGRFSNNRNNEWKNVKKINDRVLRYFDIISTMMSFISRFFDTLIMI